MKISFHSRRRGAVAIILLLALLIVMLAIVGASFRSLCNLDRQLKSIEKQQIQRLGSLSATNAPAILSPPPTNAPSAGLLPIESTVTN